MPYSRLPAPLVKDLRLMAQRKSSLGLLKTFSFLKNADHRTTDVGVHGIDRRQTGDFGYRVRKLNVSRRYPQVGHVIVKRVHVGKAKEVIRQLANFVTYHNKVVQPKTYQLLMPRAYRLNDKADQYVAMSVVDQPTLDQVIGILSQSTVAGKLFHVRYGVSPKGRFFLAQLQHQHGLTADQITTAFTELIEHTKAAPVSNSFSKIDVASSNFFLEGFDPQSGKVIFSPLIDLV